MRTRNAFLSLGVVGCIAQFRSRSLRITRRITGIIIIVALMRVAPNAQTVDLTEKSLEDLMNVQVTSVSRKEQKLSQTAAAVFVISRDDIDRSGALSIPDLLRMVPGLEVAQIARDKWAISSRGFNLQYSNKLLVLVDGRTVYGPIFAGVYWDTQNIPLNTIERIEVIRGPGAAIWGPNAVNGVINIITRPASDTQGGSVQASSGKEEIGPETLIYGGKARRLGAYRLYAEGFQQSALPVPGMPENPDGWQVIHGGFRTDGNLSAKDSLMTEGEGYQGYAGEFAEMPVSLQPPTNAVLRLQDHFSGWNALARWNHKASTQSETSLQVYFDRNTRGDSTYGVGLNTFDADFNHHFTWGPRQDIVWGLGYRLSADGTATAFRVLYTPAHRTMQLFGAFLQDQIALSKNFSLTLGGRLQHNDYTGFDLEPSARLVWTPQSRSMIWAAVSGADRTPSRSDRDIRVNYTALPGTGGLPILIGLFGNPNQKNEHVNAFEAGYRQTWTHQLSLDYSAFYNRYRDLTSEEPGPPTVELTPQPTHLLVPSSFGNGLYGETHGAEVFANLKILSRWTISPGYAFTTMHLHRFTGSQDTTLVASTQGAVPNHQAQLRSSVLLPGRVEWNTSGYFVDRLPAQLIPSYTRVDTELTWRAAERLSVSIVGQNLLQDTHPEYNGIDATVLPGLVRRDAYGRVSWSF